MSYDKFGQVVEETQKIDGEIYKLEVFRGVALTGGGSRDVAEVKRILDPETGEDLTQRDSQMVKRIENRINYGPGEAYTR